MSWWRKKQEQDSQKDNILDLDTVVWRGMDPMERVERLASSAQHEDDMNEGRVPPPLQNNYVPTTPLPSVPLPVKEVGRFVSTDASPDTLAEHPAGTPTDGSPTRTPLAVMESTHDEGIEAGLKPRDLTAEEEMIEAEIRAELINTATPQDDTPTEVSPTEDTSAPTPNTPQHIQATSTKDGMTPDVSDAIKNIVADELGGWLSHNVQRIIAESVTATLTEHAPPPPKTVKPKAAKKTSAKKAPKKVAKKAKKPAKKAASTSKAKKTT